MPVTSITAFEEPLAVVVVVGEVEVARWEGYRTPVELESFARSLATTAIGVQGRRILSSVAALEHALEGPMAFSPRRRRGEAPDIRPVADFRGLVEVDSPGDGVLWQWTRDDAGED